MHCVHPQAMMESPQCNLMETSKKWGIWSFSGDFIQREGQKTTLVKAVGSQVDFTPSESRSKLLPGKVQCVLGDNVVL